MKIPTLTFILPLLVISSTVGCSGLSVQREELALLEIAKRAYHNDPCAPSTVTKYSRHYERGYKQGYYNVSKGMGDCPPSTPPESYWSVRYKSPEGCRKIAAWYSGFRSGASAAQRDCRHLFSDVPFNSLCEREDACLCCPEEALRFGEQEHSLLPAPSAGSANAAPLPIETDAVGESAREMIQQSTYEFSVERLPELDLD